MPFDKMYLFDFTSEKVKEIHVFRMKPVSDSVFFFCISLNKESEKLSVLRNENRAIARFRFVLWPVKTMGKNGIALKWDNSAYQMPKYNLQTHFTHCYNPFKNCMQNAREKEKCREETRQDTANGTYFFFNVFETSFIHIFSK